MAKRHHWLNEINNFLEKIANGGTQLKFASGHLSHAFAIKKPKKQNPEKNPNPENITEKIREKEAEKIAFSLKICLS